MRRAARTVALSAVALLVAGCSDTPTVSQPPASVPAVRGTVTPPPTVPPSPADGFAIQAFELAAVEGAPDPAQVRAQVGRALDRYLDEAVLAPLRSGQPAGDLSELFAGAAAERVGGPDRAALVDEGLPPVTGLAVEKAAASVAVLAGAGGRAGFATASISTVLKGSIGVTPLTVERYGILELEPDGETWKITGYEIHVDKGTAEESASTGA